MPLPTGSQASAALSSPCQAWGRFAAAYVPVRNAYKRSLERIACLNGRGKIAKEGDSFPPHPIPLPSGERETRERLITDLEIPF
jgi:hypothetical protein